MKTQNFKNAGAALMAAMIATAAHGQILGVYSFTDADNGDMTGFPVENPASNVTFSTLDNTGLTGIGVVSAFFAANEAPLSNNGSPPYPFDGKGFQATYGNIRNTVADPDASTDYLQFSVTPTAGHKLTINSITADLGTDFTLAFDPPVWYNLWYSLDDATYHKIGDPSNIPSNSNVFRIRNNVPKTFVANAAAIPSGTETIYFRLAFGLGGLSGTDQKRLFIDDITINGTSEPIPDPVLAVDFDNTASVDFNFGNVFGNEPRRVTFVCRSAGGAGTVEIENILLTNDADGIFTLGSITYSDTANQPVLSNGDSVTIEVIANNSRIGNFAGQLAVETNSTGGTAGAFDNDLTLPLIANTIADQALLNANPVMDTGLAGWGGNGAFVAPGIAPGSVGMARVRGAGDPAGSVQGSHFQTAVPNGLSDFEFIAYFTPIDASKFADYVDPDDFLGVEGPDGAFTDRTFHWVLLGSDANPPSTAFGNTQAANTIISLAYMPDGTSTGGDPDFYVFDQDAASWEQTGIGEIAGSIDNDADGNPLNGIGDGRLDSDADPADVINVYKLIVTGSGLGSAAASYDVSVAKVSGPDPFTSGSATGLTAFHGLDGTMHTATGHAFITSDTSSDSNSGEGLRTPFWVDDVFLFNGSAPDPQLIVLGAPSTILLPPSETTGSTSFMIRNNGPSTHLEITSIDTGTSGFDVTSATSLSLAPGEATRIDIAWDSANSGYTPNYETAQLTIHSSNNAPVTVNLQAAVLVDVPIALENGNFETPGTDTGTNTDTFAFWDELLSASSITAVPGLIAPSATAASLAPATSGTSILAQNVTSPPLINFTLEFDFAIPKVGRDLYLHLESAGSLSRTNIGYNSAANTFIAYNQATTSFINVLPINLTAGTPYKLRVTGTNWGLSNPSTVIEVMNASGDTLGATDPFTYFQYAAPVGGLNAIAFTTEFGGSGGIRIDEITLNGEAIDTSPPAVGGLELANPVFVTGTPNTLVADIIGGTVDIYRSTTLLPGSWTGPIATGVGPGAGVVIDPDAASPKAFYIAVPAGGTAP